MSSKLREIIAAFSIKDPRFFKNTNEQIIENLEDGTEKFTGFYQNDEGSFFEEEVWLKEQAEKKKRIRIENEKRMQKWQAEQANVLKQQQEKLLTQPQQKRRANYKPLIFIILLIAIVATIVIWAITYFGDDSSEQKTVEQQVRPIEESVAQEIYGNALITGNNVNIRKAPSINAPIVSNVPEENERVVVVLKPINTKDWIKIARKNKDTGWVYYKFLNDSI